MKPRESFKIKIPGMNVRRMSACAFEPWQISANGIEEPGPVCEKRTEEEQPDENRGGERKCDMTGGWKIGSRAGARGATRPTNAHSNCGNGDRCERDHKGFLGRVHQADARAGENRPFAVPGLEVAPQRSEQKRCKKDQQHFVNEIAAIENHGRRNGDEQRGPNKCALVQAIEEKQKSKN